MYRTVRCLACGHVYCSPRLENMYQYYKDVEDEGYLHNEPLRTETARNVIQTIQKFAPAGRLLDVGCSTGDFLQVAREYYQVEGLELSHWALEVAKHRGLTVHPTKLNEITGAHESFDIVTLWGVIEHFEYPKSELERVNRALKMDGIVCLWTGDVDSFYSKFLGSMWWYRLGQHIQFFSWKSMDHLMSDCGFTRVYKGVYPYVISFEYLGISLSRYFLIGRLAKILFSLAGLRKRRFVLRKSDEMFGIYRKVRRV